MFPIIYDQKTTDFNSNSLGRLSDVISCTVTEALNGEYTLEMSYADNGLNHEYLKPRNILYVKPNHSNTMQAFRIYKVTRSIKNNYKVYANHICYDLSGYQILPFSASTLTATMSYFSSAASPFSINSNMEADTSFTVEVPSSIRSWFGGSDGSLVNVYGGEWRYDNFNCSLLEQRGRDIGVRISYGMNLAEYERERESRAYSHVLMYYSKENSGVKTVVYGDAVETGFSAIQRTLILNVTEEYEDTVPTSTTLTNATASYIHSNFSELTSDIQTITVTPELIGTDRIALGDMVHVSYEGNLISTRAVKYEWDVLNERYNKIELGTKKTTISETIKSITSSSTNTSQDAPNYIECGLSANATVSVSTAWSYATIPLDTTNASYNASNIFSLSSNVITVVQSGYYRLSACVRVNSTSTSLNVYAGIFIGSTLAAISIRTGGATSSGGATTAPIIRYISAGQTVSVGITTSATGSFTVQNGGILNIERL